MPDVEESSVVCQDGVKRPGKLGFLSRSSAKQSDLVVVNLRFGESI